MASRRRILIAAQPTVSDVLQRMLGDLADTVAVHTAADAFELLAPDAARIDLIVCTFGFDESRMVEFLLEAKRRPETGAIPFLVVRVIRRFLSDELIARLGPVARQCGAAGFVDLARLDEGAAREALRAVVADLLAH